MVLSAALLWWVYRDADGPALWQALRDVPLWAVLAAGLVSCLSIPLRARQLRLLLGDAPEVTPWLAVRTISLGNLVSSLVPARGGEPVKALLLSRWTGLALPRVLTSLVIARVLDLGCIMILFGLMFVFLPFSGGLSAAAWENLGKAMVFLGATAAVSAAVLVVLSLNRVRFGDWMRVRLTRISPAAGASWDRLWTPVQQALGVIRATNHLSGAVALNLLCWFAFFLTPVPMLLALGLGWPDILPATLGIVGLTTLAHLFPAAPTSLGTYHATCLLGLAVWCPEIERSLALAFTLLFHPVDTMATGIPGLFMVPGAWDDLRSARKEKTDRTAVEQSTSYEKRG